MARKTRLVDLSVEIKEGLGDVPIESAPAQALSARLKGVKFFFDKSY
jgi:hypothetical protein